MISHVSVAVMYVADQDKSLDFHVGKFGFAKKIDEEMWPGARWVEVVPPKGQTSMCCRAPLRLTRAGRGRVSNVACDDIHATVKELRERGVTVTDPVEEQWGTYIKATDPDGHEVQISEKD